MQYFSGNGFDLYATDVDATATAYLAKAFPQVHVGTNRFQPPTDYPENFFDVVYSVSIWTHLATSDQEPWLREVRRILKPGGLALITTLGFRGVNMVKRFGAEAEQELRAKGIDDEGTRAPLEVRPSWARLIRQVYEIDPLLCPRCGGTMKVIAVIEPACADLLARGAQASTADRRQAVVRQILAHLGLLTTAPGLRAPPDQPASRVADPPREWSYQPFRDDLPIPDPAIV